MIDPRELNPPRGGRTVTLKGSKKCLVVRQDAPMCGLCGGMVVPARGNRTRALFRLGCQVRANQAARRRLVERVEGAMLCWAFARNIARRRQQPGAVKKKQPGVDPPPA